MSPPGVFGPEDRVATAQIDPLPLLFRRVLLVRAGGDRKSLPNGPILKQAGKALPEGKSLLTEAGIFPESRGRVFPLGLSPFSSTPMGWAPCHLSNLAPFLAAKWRLTMHVASSRRVAYSAGSELSLETVTRSCSAGVLTGAIGGDEDIAATANVTRLCPFVLLIRFGCSLSRCEARAGPRPVPPCRAVRRVRPYPGL